MTYHAKSVDTDAEVDLDWLQQVADCFTDAPLGLQPVLIFSGPRLKDGRLENTCCFLFEDPIQTRGASRGDSLQLATQR
jgi:hypothetical protein